MNTRLPMPFLRRSQAAALLGLPALLIVVFLLHFRGAERFADFQWRYMPRAPAEVVRSLATGGAHAPLLHDPHVIAYLALPLFMLCASALLALAKRHRPLAGMLAAFVTFTGVVYLGGLFGMWSAFYSGLSQVDPRHVDGATATFAAMTAPQGAFLLTTSLAKLAFVGFALQALALVGLPSLPRWSPWLVVAGCGLFLAFWDLDNWMLIGAALLLAGFVPMARMLGSREASAA